MLVTAEQFAGTAKPPARGKNVWLSRKGLLIPRGQHRREIRTFAPAEVAQRSEDYVILLLNGNREIHIEGGRRVDGFAGSRPAVLDDLQGRQVTDVRVVSRTEMVITFDAGIGLRLFDDSNQYERVQFYPECIIV